MELLIYSESNLLLDGISSLVERRGHLVRHRAQRIEDVVPALRRAPIDACILELGDVGCGAREMVEEVNALVAPPRVVALARNLDDTLVEWAADAGIGSLLPSSVRSGDLMAALDRHPSAHAASARPSRSSAEAQGLSPTEVRVLEGLCSGRSTRVLAADLGVAESTIRSHVRAIHCKLGVRSRVAAVLLAVSLGIGVAPVEVGPPPAPEHADLTRAAADERRDG